MSTRIILGIDPGTTITGYGVIAVRGSNIRLLACGALHVARQAPDHPTRLKNIFGRIQGLIEEFQPREMALEAPFYGKNVQSMLKLGRAQGVAMAAGLMSDMQIYEYAPRKVKMAITGRGAASKEQVLGMLEQLLNQKLELESLDASDGLAVAVCHAFQRQPGQEGKNYRNWGDYLKQNPDRKRS